MPQFWIEFGPGLALAIATVVVGAAVDSLRPRGGVDVRAAYKVLLVAALFVALGGFFLIDGVRHNSIRGMDALAWLVLIVACAATSIGFVMVFLRWRISAETDGFRVQRSIGPVILVSWQALRSVSVSYGSVKFDALPIARPSADWEAEDCRVSSMKSRHTAWKSDHLCEERLSAGARRYGYRGSALSA
jgi:hypothetical protein